MRGLLYLAALGGHEEAVRILVAAGADLEEMTEDHRL
jgi:hypothetical protein